MWTVTDYGVLRYDANAPTKRDIEQRFMGDRYFYEADTTDGKVLAIIPDGECGIWTVMHSGFSHISMAEMSGTQKAELMSDVTRTYVDRREWFLKLVIQTMPGEHMTMIMTGSGPRCTVREN